jgi:cell wall-associated NlpC family hydrolase
MSCRTTRSFIAKFLVVFAVVLSSLAAIAPVASAHDRDTYWQQRRELRHRARGQLGAPYRSGGTSPSGFDCSGFTRWVFDVVGSDLPHSAQRQFDLARRRGFARIWKRGKLKVGDLVFQRTTSAQVGHAGMYIGNGKFISSTSSGGVQIRSLYDPYYWGPRWVGATRLPVTMRYRRASA